MAVKVLHDQSEKRKVEFANEANILKTLRFENVVSYYGCAFHGIEVGCRDSHLYVQSFELSDTDDMQWS